MTGNVLKTRILLADFQILFPVIFFIFCENFTQQPIAKIHKDSMQNLCIF